MNEVYSMIKLFKSYIDDSEVEFEADKDALKKGIIIDKNAPKDVKEKAIKVWGIDGFLINQTFHKSFEKVTSSSLEKLVIEQLVHYFTTYGYEALGIKDGTVYIPSEMLDVPDLEDGYNFIFIKKISFNDFKRKLWNLCESGIALSRDTLENMEELSSYMDIDKENISKIKNKEFRVRMYDKFSIVPENPEEFFRYLLYKLTGSSLLIKDDDTMGSLKSSNKTKAYILINRYKDNYGLTGLAQIFNRFKPLFLSLKTDISELGQFYLDEDEIEDDYSEDCKKLNSYINKISHLSKKYHKPFQKNDLDMFCDWVKFNKDKKDFDVILKEKLKEAGVFRAIRILNYLNDKGSNRVYKIRNGKAWVCEKDSKKSISKDVLSTLEDYIVSILKKNVSSKKIYLDDKVNLVLPQSEKQFMGNIPFGSSICFDKDNLIVGIHWFDTDDRIDLDLKIISNDYSIGWNTNYKKEDKLIFSGDVTAAPKPNGASEYIYIDKSVDDTIFSLKVNNFTSYVEGCEFEFIIAKASKDDICKNYIVNPNNIILRIPGNKLQKGMAEHSIGNIIVNDDIKLVFTDLCTSNRSVSFNNDVENILREFTLYDSENRCFLKDFLVKAGAIMVDKREEADIDLSINNLNKDSIISLFK